jgi:hypothetical protein
MMSVLNGSVLKSTITSVDKEKSIAKINIKKIDVGMSGFVVHHLDNDHSSIVANATVKSFSNGVATLKLSEFSDLENSALPNGKWSVQKGDTAVLAFGYSKALFISPNAEIYNRITKSTKNMQWLHPDIFATLLSINGHPTPLKEDFEHLSSSSYVGLVFIYLDSKVYTVDIKSFKILNTLDVALEQKSEMLPFYSRVEEIDAAWFGEGSGELDDYEPHYYELLIEHNPKNENLKKLYEQYKEKQEG